MLNQPIDINDFITEITAVLDNHNITADIRLNNCPHCLELYLDTSLPFREQMSIYTQLQPHCPKDSTLFDQQNSIISIMLN